MKKASRASSSPATPARQRSSKATPIKPAAEPASEPAVGAAAVGTLPSEPCTSGCSPAGTAESRCADPGVVDPGVVDPGVVDPGVVDPGVVDPGIVEQGVVEQDALEHIRRAAYCKWIDAGYPAGDGVEFWVAAEREYLEQHKMPDPSGCADVVQEASEESFPASDPPAWGGSRRSTSVR